MSCARSLHEFTARPADDAWQRGEREGTVDLVAHTGSSRALQKWYVGIAFKAGTICSFGLAPGVGSSPRITLLRQRAPTDRRKFDRIPRSVRIRGDER